MKTIILITALVLISQAGCKIPTITDDAEWKRIITLRDINSAKADVYMHVAMRLQYDVSRLGDLKLNDLAGRYLDTANYLNNRAIQLNEQLKKMIDSK